jgi:hypothetical protein
MRDREFINRFCAFYINTLDEYKGDMDDFLALALRRMNKSTNAELSRVSSEFRLGLENNYALFGKHAFRKHTDPKGYRSVLNASLWDVMSTGLSRYPNEEVMRQADAIRAGFYGLMNDSDFIDAITYSPNTTWKVRHRFEAARKMIEGALSVKSA